MSYLIRTRSVPGVDVTVAMAVVAAVGDFSRFESPDRLRRPRENHPGPGGRSGSLFAAR